MRLLKRFTNRFIFCLLHNSRNVDEPGRVPSIEINGSRKEKRLENTAGGVRPPISAFPSMSWPVLWHVAEHCHAEGWLILIPYDGLTWFQQLIIYHTELVPPNAEHNLGTVNIRTDRRGEGKFVYSPLFSALEIIVVTHFSSPVMMRCKNPFWFSRLPFVRNSISLLLNHSHGFEAFRNGLLSYSQWFGKFFLHLARVFSK